ncbi:MAG: PEP-CTERM sorting domain-containing protein [Sphingobium sp.]|nr:PEP-CTERM sorting domain-containing protein [Sphingobium sp.]
MNKYVLGAMAAFALAAPAMAGAATFPIGSSNFFITSGTPFTPSITASFFNGFQTSTSFDDSFTFTIPQNGVGSGSISTSFSSGSENKLTISSLFVNGISYALTTTASGQSATIGNIPIKFGVLNTIRVVGSTNGSGVYSGTATFAALPVPEPSVWAMMIIGFGAVGMAFRRRSTSVAFS